MRNVSFVSVDWSELHLVECHECDTLSKDFGLEDFDESVSRHQANTVNIKDANAFVANNVKKPYQPVYVHSKDGFQSTKFISDNED